MSGMTNSTTTEAIDLIVDCGFSPVADDLADFMPIRANMVEWLERRFDGVMALSDGRLLVTSYFDDSLLLAVLTANGATVEEVRFPAPDDEVSALAAAAFRAVVMVWGSK